jgi:hypothetical protein
VHQLTETEKTKHVLIGKLTAIIGHCELLVLEAESPECRARLVKIKCLALDSADMVLTCAADHEHVEEHEELAV